MKNTKILNAILTDYVIIDSEIYDITDSIELNNRQSLIEHAYDRVSHYKPKKSIDNPYKKYTTDILLNKLFDIDHQIYICNDAIDVYECEILDLEYPNPTELYPHLVYWLKRKIVWEYCKKLNCNELNNRYKSLQTELAFKQFIKTIPTAH